MLCCAVLCCAMLWSVLCFPFVAFARIMPLSLLMVAIWMLDPVIETTECAARGRWKDVIPLLFGNRQERLRMLREVIVRHER